MAKLAAKRPRKVAEDTARQSRSKLHALRTLREIRYLIAAQIR
jgi:hypothetical protein